MLAPSHILLLGLLLVLALVVFGPKRLPELGHSVGRAIQEFKHASSQAVQGIAQVTEAAGTATTTTTTTATPISPTGPVSATPADDAGPMPVAPSTSNAREH